MILAIDAGNTRIKWGLHDGQHWVQQGWGAHAQAQELAAAWGGLPAPRRILIANVAGAELGDRLQEWLGRVAAGAEWVKAGAVQCGVRNGYDQPGQLGSDRWAALIGAWGLQRRGCLAVNAGTAMTVDALSDEGVFLGGIIVPGMAAMADALVARTAALRQAQGAFQAFPTNTADAMHSGALDALAGAVERMRAQLAARLGREPACIVSGGDGPLLQPLLGKDTIMVENLVLEGLVRIALA